MSDQDFYFCFVDTGAIEAASENIRAMYNYVS